MGNKVPPGKSQKGSKDTDKPSKTEIGASNIVQPFREGTTMTTESKLKELLRNAGDG